MKTIFRDVSPVGGSGFYQPLSAAVVMLDFLIHAANSLLPFTDALLLHGQCWLVLVSIHLLLKK